ncbi:hypothetical protein [Kordiimonas sp. SCSIO 12610]|uniref:endonuclease/exonuclease/phosphatase family protein n=1 Tax=Kordiimonas sp. SCSIO 12610 TaxID=2829597 RepID=UPI00210D1ED0|nr:hypothetical protein [Kordiimonas sp. SCSIO 12610]UTW56560.1 hypothetical protein KFF44_06580 [Kordiimonas sp. SCSIO 12610]
MAIIASQNFNAISSANTRNEDDNLQDGDALTNAGANHVSTGDGDLGFQTLFTNTRGTSNEAGTGSGPAATDSSDFIGVNSFTGSNAPDVAADGTAIAAGTEHNFQFNDTDGNLALVFDSVDVSGFQNRTVSLNYFINDTGYESDDAFTITISDGTTTVTVLDFGEAELEGNASADDGSANWNTLNIDLDQIIADNGLDATNITLTVNVDTNSGSENIFVDNIAFEGEEANIVFGTAVTGSDDDVDPVQSISTDDFSSAGDGFGIFQRGVSPSIPFALLDDTTTFASDNLGIVQSTDTAEFFGVTDTQNGDNNGPVTAEFTFDIGGASNPFVSLDLAAMGDFEANDTFTFEVAFDDGSFAPLFTLTTDEDGVLSYTLEDGRVVELNDPTVLSESGTVLSNVFQNFFSQIEGSGDTLTLRLTAQTDGSEAFAFRNVVVSNFAPEDSTQVGDLVDGDGGDGGTGGGDGDGPATNIVINEIDADNVGTDSSEFIELYDGGVGNTPLDGLVLVLFNGNNDQSYRTIDLTGFTTDENGFFVVGSENVDNVDLVAFTTNGIQNGADAVALYIGSAADFPNGSVATADNLDILVDAIVYGTNDGVDTGLLTALGQDTQFNESANGASDQDALARDVDGTGTFVAQGPTPGASNIDDDGGDGGTGGGGGGAGENPGLTFNEFRISSPGAGDNTSNFIELIGEANQSLDGLTLLVLSGEFSPGTIDFAFDLTGSSTDADGIFVVGNPDSGISFDAGDLQASFDLFGSPTTFLIVENFTGNVGDDLDTNDDGTFDVTPFGNIINGLSLVDGDDNPDVNYGGIIVGPDGPFAPAHGFRIDNGVGEFTIGDFGDQFNDTPGELNREPMVPVSDDVTSLVGDADHLTTLAYNIRSVDNFATGTLFDNSAGIADHIVNFSGSPDIIALQEVSNEFGEQVLQDIVDAIAAAGGPVYEIVFVPSDIVGAVGTTTITNAFLYRPDRVDFVEGSAQLLTDVQVGTSFPRFPLIGEFTFNGETVTLINAHLSSGSAGSDPDVNGDAAERLEQAQELTLILDSLLDADPDANVIVLGDYNDTQFGEPTIELLDDELTNLFTEADQSELTTNTFGNPIDHIAVSDSLAASAEFDYIRVNADFGNVVSDHDPVLARFLFRQDAVETITSPIGFERSRADAIANATDVSLVNSGGLQNYFDISRLRGAEIQIIQDGVDDFQIIIGFRGRFFTAYDFDNVGSLGNNADANLYEFLSSLEGSGLPAGAAFSVGRVADFNSDAPVDFASLEFSELHIALDREIVDASGSRAFDTSFDRVAFLTGGRDGVAAAGDNDILIGENNRDSFVEVLIGGDGDDLLIGGRGTDQLNGGAGSDDYLYRLGDGDDTIIESGEGFDTLTFGEGISASDITITQDVDDLDTFIILIDDGSSDGSTIRLTSEDDDFGGIDQIVFADGTTLNDDDGFGGLLTL